MERIDIDKKYRVVSLFAGIGGFDIGFQNAGFDIKDVTKEIENIYLMEC